MGTTPETIAPVDEAEEIIKNKEDYRYEGPKAPGYRVEFITPDYNFDFSNIFNPTAPTQIGSSTADFSAFEDMMKKSLEYANKLSLSNIGMGNINTGELLNPFYRGSRSDATVGQQHFRQAVSKSKLGTGALQIPLSAPTAPKV